jgi:eukaryotic-like serine/threonine-protein kinase
VALPSRPKRFGPYEVIVKIAGGGMATVYLAREKDASGAERLVAVKVIRHDLRHDERFVQMFLDEAKVLARLSHANLAATYESGTDAEQHFIAMELLVGRTLLEVWEACKAKGLSLRLDHAAWICARVADALHSAHELSDEHGAPLHIIHRDVNPANIMLTFEGDVKLYDFGLAKSRGKQSKSTHGIVKGKLPYLSPEQIESVPIDRRADIFMLGTTLWELTTMRRLFKKENDVETVAAVRAALVPDPRARVPTYPETLWNIVRRTLARGRDHRYATAAEVSRDLDDFVASQGSAEDMPSLTSEILDALFPGERQRQALWLRRAKSPPGKPVVTVPPPTTVSAAHSPSLAPPSRTRPAPSKPPPLPPKRRHPG